MNTSIIIPLVCGWIIGAILAYIVSLFCVFYDSEYPESEVKAKIILWPLTIVIYLLIGSILLLKHVFLFMIDILKGFWQFIKSIPKIIVDL